MEKRPLLICTDPGIDDFIALSMLLARPEFDVLGMIALSGNVGLDVTLNNALLAAELNGRPDIPVLSGSAKPLARPARTASNIHGKSRRFSADGLVFTLQARLPRFCQVF